MEKKTIGTFIAALRKANGLTQKQLADMLNVSDKAVSRWERDECAPDLSLIPVLAEIFNVTADEILRGQRANPDQEPRPADTVKSQRQRANLLRSAQSRFRIRSILYAAMPLVGVILACILNFEFSAPNGGFLICLIFTLCAAVLQIMNYILSKSSLGDEDDKEQSVTTCKLSMLYWTETVLSGALIALAFTAPLAGSQERVSFLNCLTTGCKFALGGAAVAAAVCFSVNLIHARRCNSAGAGRVLVCRTLTVLLLIGVLIGHICLNSFLLGNRHLYAPCETYTELDKFREVMEEHRTPEGYRAYIQDEYFDKEYNRYLYLYIYEDPFTGEKTIYDHYDLVRTLTEPTAPHRTFEKHFVPEYGYEFFHFNRSIVHYEVTGGEDFVPIYTFTQEQFRQSEQTATAYSLLYAFAYTLPIGIGCILNCLLRRKQK